MDSAISSKNTDSKSSCCAPGFRVTFGHLLVYNLWRLDRPLSRPLIAPLGALIQLLAYGLDRIDRTEMWTWNNLIAVKKK